MQKEDSEASSRKIKTIVFLTPRPVSTFEAEKWCFSYLRIQGFEVEVLDLTKLLNKDDELVNSVINSIVQPLQGEFIHRVNSHQEFECFVKKFSDNSLFIDFLVGHSTVTLKEERIFRLLKKSNARYSFLSSGALPLSSSLELNTSIKTKAFLSKVENAIIDPYKLLNYLASRIILFLTRHHIVYPLPTVIFGGDSDVLRCYVEARDIDKSKIVPINSFDYDTSVLFQRNLGNKLPESEDICVFLDEGATDHSDFAILGIEPADAESYFAAMNHFFDFIEKNTRLKVIIASHPRSNYETMPTLFGGRAVIKGKTVELVARSKLVVMHMSTALSYVVLFKKPVIPVKIPGVRVGSQSNLMVETMAAAIGSKPVDFDKDEFTSSLLQRECNLEKYSEYEMRYVKNLGADDSMVWEIVAKTVKNM